MGFGFDKLNYTFSFSIMILIQKPPFKSTSSIKKFPTWTCITTIWWSMVIEINVGFGKVGFDGTELRM